ncbi:MAG: phospho-sugar mutase [Clostridia bacterium]|nr:phospho-sugar mutase [Clostridia bacterium]
MDNNTARKSLEKWLNYDALDNDMRAELEAIKDDENEVVSRFYGNLTFGTAGLRGVMAAGTARMNVYTVMQATQGLCHLIIGENACDRGVAIAYDTRNNSRLFAECSARVLAANGIKAYLFDDARPTPELSFALRHLGCIAGINITASHNTKEYNGYKAYWEDGAQLPPDHADTVCAAIEKVDIFTGVKTVDLDEAIADGRVAIIGREVDEAFLDSVFAVRLNPKGFDKAAEEMSIVYTPLHGAGWKHVPEIFDRMGFKHISVVPSQATPDGEFPTVKKPNPEIADVFVPGIELADRVGADLVIATDPDCDRVGVMIRKADGSFDRISGNAMGAMLLDYILSAMKEEGGIPEDAYAVKTIVSTELFARICEANGVKCYNVLTGFKFIGEVIKKHELVGRGTYIIGFEESYGYLKGTYARDKDAVCGSMLIAEMAAYYRTKGMTLADALDSLFERYGYFAESTQSIDIVGHDAAEKMKNITADLRSAPPTEICGSKVVGIGDYREGFIRDLKTGREKPTGLPSSDVLRYALENGDVVLVRPSGTEPKVKVYFLTSAESKAALAEKMALCEAEAKRLTQTD